jgi:hypothetical protein
MSEDLVILELNARWGCDIPFGWIPMTGDYKLPNTEIYYSEFFDDNLIENIKHVIKCLYTDKLFEILEGGAVSVQYLDNCFFGYNGLEHLHTNDAFDFVLYFSHESTVTVGGRQLLEEIHRLWPEYKNHLWTGELQ